MGRAGATRFDLASGGFGGITEQRSYNGRLELSTVQTSSSAGGAENLTYNYPSSANNGSVSSITNSLNTGLSESFTYDSLNRVLSGATSSSSASGCWGQSFGPSGSPPPGPPEDRYGNLTAINSTQCSSGSLSVTVNASTNQISTSGFAYDSDGNMTKDGTGYTYTFDAENRLTQASGMSGGPWNYMYDGNSVRVKKSNSSGGILYWRSIWGDALAESDLQGNITNEYVFMAGRRIARRDSSGHVYYYYPDALGSPMTITDSSGNPCYVATYTPYGQETATTNTCPQNYKYTGYEQDAETGLYYAFARYYSPRLGRFLSPDPLAGDISNPQSLNRYAYVANNPLNAVDPRGMECGPLSDGLVLACEETGGGGGGGDGVDIIGAMTGAFLGYFSAANGNMGMSGRNLVDYMNNQFMRATFGDSYYDLPGYANPKEQDEANYLGAVAEGLKNVIKEALLKQLKSAVRAALLSDPNCLVFLGGGEGAGPLSALDTIPMNVSDEVRDPGVVAWTTGRIQNSTNPLTSAPPVIKINSNGWFFYQGARFPGVPFGSGTPAFQALVLLHELGHATGVLRPDLNNATANAQNNARVLERCRSAINRFIGE